MPEDYVTQRVLTAPDPALISHNIQSLHVKDMKGVKLRSVTNLV